MGRDDGDGDAGRNDEENHPQNGLQLDGNLVVRHLEVFGESEGGRGRRMTGDSGDKRYADCALRDVTRVM